ncbi:MAG: alpha/beta hydrolase [Rhizobiaceae bacterium]
MNNIFSIAAMAAAVYSMVVLALFVFQSRLVYFPNMPSRTIGSAPDSIGLAYETVAITAEDGINLHAWYIPALKRRGVVLFFHGNAGNISHRLDSLKIFHELNLDTLIFDYRGYGRSDGKVSEQGTYRDADAVWRYLTVERGIPAADIVLFGRSLGAAIAAYVASRHGPGAIVLESGFVSVPEMAATLYPWLPARQLARIGYPTGEYLQAASRPVLIVHSRGDDIIPFDQGKKLFELANEPKHFLELRGSHNDGFLVSRRHYLTGLDKFLAASLTR